LTETFIVRPSGIFYSDDHDLLSMFALNVAGKVTRPFAVS